MPEEFSHDVAEAIGIYIYRLIDPRNGETFYVGKGTGNRVFQHANGAIAVRNIEINQNSPEDEFQEDSTDLKIRRIRDIKQARLDVLHIIHRHHIASDEMAYQIEAALIDAYPGLSNKVSGHGSGDYGCRHATEIILEYTREEFEARDRLILINIGRSFEEHDDPYNAVRAAWKISRVRAETYPLVLAHSLGIIRGAYHPTQWLRATVENFPWIERDMLDRWGFEGEQASPEIWQRYVGKRVPAEYRRPGAASPIRYVDVDCTRKSDVRDDRRSHLAWGEGDLDFGNPEDD